MVFILVSSSQRLFHSLFWLLHGIRLNRHLMNFINLMDAFFPKYSVHKTRLFSPSSLQGPAPPCSMLIRLLNLDLTITCQEWSALYWADLWNVLYVFDFFLVHTHYRGFYLSWKELPRNEKNLFLIVVQINSGFTHQGLFGECVSYIYRERERTKYTTGTIFWHTIQLLINRKGSSKMSRKVQRTGIWPEEHSLIHGTYIRR